MKNIVFEIKNKINRIKSKLDGRRKKISELEDIPVKTISNEAKKEKERQKNSLVIRDNSKCLTF